MITVQGPDPSDVLVLCAHVVEDTPAGKKEARLPFVYVNDSTESPSLVVPWGPPPFAIVAKVNSGECKTPEELYSKVKGAVDARKTPIVIEIYGPDVETLRPLALPPQELRKWLSQQLRLPETKVEAVLTPGEWCAIFVGMSILCFSIAASALIIMLGLAVLYAVMKGYMPISVEEETEIGEWLKHKLKIVIGQAT
jgi:hypothetical protein